MKSNRILQTALALFVVVYVLSPIDILPGSVIDDIVLILAYALKDSIKEAILPSAKPKDDASADATTIEPDYEVEDVG